jgi:hypothetical protein
MRIVVDSNILKDEALRAFLSKSRKNKAIISDYLSIEALKDDPLGKMFGLMKILCEFPKQVIVLKPLRSLSVLKARRSGMTRRMIEKQQSKGYSEWCEGLQKAERGDEAYRKQLVAKGKEATKEIERVVAAQATYAEVIAEEAKAYTQDELRILRADQPYTEQMIAKMAERIVSLTTKFYERHPDKPEPPNVSDLRYSYMFRLAVCAYLQTLARIRDGGAQSVTAKNVANDIIDATFVAQATYFQGLLSKDEKANALLRNAKHILKAFPVAPSKLKAAKA